MTKPRSVLLILNLLVAAACAAAPVAPTATSQPETEANPADASEPASTTDVERPSIFAEMDGVRAVSLLPAPDGGVYMAAGADETFTLYRLSAQGELEELGVANPDSRALVSSIEPPGFTLDAEGDLHLTWTDTGGQVWYARADGQSLAFSAAVQVNQSSDEHHAIMPVSAIAEDGAINVVWLQGLSMQLAQSDDGGATFTQTQLEEEVCDCCRPQPFLVDGDLYIAYRESLYDEDGRNYRDVHLGRYADGAFEAWPVADEHWYLNACPVAGPGFVVADGQFALAWMDGRANQNGSLAQSDIWFASSATDEIAFSANLRINQGEGVFNHPPVLVQAEDGRLFIAWIADEGAKSTILYAMSEDGGQSFSDPAAVFVSNGPLTAPRSVALAHSGESLYLAYTDLDGLKILRISD